METFSALLALCEGKPLVIGEFPSQRPVTRSFDVFLDLRLNKWMLKQSRRQWFETPSRSLLRDCNAIHVINISYDVNKFWIFNWFILLLIGTVIPGLIFSELTEFIIVAQ